MKPIIKQALIDEEVTATSTVTEPVSLLGCEGYSIAAVSTFASGAANFKVQGSLDKEVWMDVSSSTALTTTIPILIEKVNPQYEWVRVEFNKSATSAVTTTIKLQGNSLDWE